jgi:RNA polymerase primary sigma factor
MRQLKISKSITNREFESLDKYLQEISKIPVITAEEEVKLAQRIRQNDKQALDKLVKSNLRFVVSVAKQYQNQGLTLPDLINDGNIGLIKAAQKYDETKGFKFISYAVWWIRQSIMQALAEQSRIVRVPVNKLSINAKVYKAFNLLEQEYEREPSNEELASSLSIDIEDINKTMAYNTKHLSFMNPLNDNSDGCLMDLMPNPNAEATDKYLFVESLRTDIELSLKVLTIRQKDVVTYFFGLGIEMPLSLDDIGERFNITKERVRQIKDIAIEKLRSTSKCKLLKTYLG